MKQVSVALIAGLFLFGCGKDNMDGVSRSSLKGNQNGPVSPHRMPEGKRPDGAPTNPERPRHTPPKR